MFIAPWTTMQELSEARQNGVLSQWILQLEYVKAIKRPQYYVNFYAAGFMFSAQIQYAQTGRRVLDITVAGDASMDAPMRLASAYQSGALRRRIRSKDGNPNTGAALWDWWWADDQLYRAREIADAQIAHRRATYSPYGFIQWDYVGQGRTW